MHHDAEDQRESRPPATYGAMRAYEFITMINLSEAVVALLDGQELSEEQRLQYRTKLVHSVSTLADVLEGFSPEDAAAMREAAPRLFESVTDGR